MNFTAYDVWHAQDCLNPCVHANVMTLSPDTDSDTSRPYHHPFQYAWILGIFHADVVHTVPGSLMVFKRMEFLWVRRFEYDYRWKAGLKRCRLHRICFTPHSDLHTFGFMDPDDMIHGAHLIPAFAHSLNTSGDDSDYNYYYVNRYVSDLQAGNMADFLL